MSSATELAYGVPPYKTVPAKLNMKMVEALQRIAQVAAKGASNVKYPAKDSAQDLWTIQMIAEYVLEEYIEPDLDGRSAGL